MSDLDQRLEEVRGAVEALREDLLARRAVLIDELRHIERVLEQLVVPGVEAAPSSLDGSITRAFLSAAEAATATTPDLNEVATRLRGQSLPTVITEFLRAAGPQRLPEIRAFVSLVRQGPASAVLDVVVARMKKAGRIRARGPRGQTRYYLPEQVQRRKRTDSP